MWRYGLRIPVLEKWRQAGDGVHHLANLVEMTSFRFTRDSVLKKIGGEQEKENPDLWPARASISANIKSFFFCLLRVAYIFCSQLGIIGLLPYFEEL